MYDLSVKSHFAFWIVVKGKSQVEQNPSALIIVEGENCTFQCNYTVSPFNNLRWYKQDTERGPASLIIMTYGETKNRMEGTQGLWIQSPRAAPCTSQPPSSSIQPSTSVWWLHCAPQALAANAQTCIWRLSRSLRRRSRSINFLCCMSFHKWASTFYSDMIGFELEPRCLYVIKLYILTQHVKLTAISGYSQG